MQLYVRRRVGAAVTFPFKCRTSAIPCDRHPARCRSSRSMRTNCPTAFGGWGIASRCGTRLTQGSQRLGRARNTAPSENRTRLAKGVAPTSLWLRRPAGWRWRIRVGMRAKLPQAQNAPLSHGGPLEMYRLRRYRFHESRRAAGPRSAVGHTVGIPRHRYHRLCGGNTTARRNCAPCPGRLRRPAHLRGSGRDICSHRVQGLRYYLNRPARNRAAPWHSHPLAVTRAWPRCSNPNC